jgi:hypothetical protein
MSIEDDDSEMQVDPADTGNLTLHYAQDKEDLRSKKAVPAKRKAINRAQASNTDEEVGTSKETEIVEVVDKESNDSSPQETDDEEATEMVQPLIQFKKGATHKCTLPTKQQITQWKKPIEDPLPSPEDDPDACAVCADPDSDPSNPITYCDGCNVAVHTACYQIANLPEGEWFCQRCAYLKKKGLDPKAALAQNQCWCQICLRTGGAMKQTTNGLWAHSACSVWCAESYHDTTKDRENLDDIIDERKSLVCQICKRTTPHNGACQQCYTCGRSFHPMCSKTRKGYHIIHLDKGEYYEWRFFCPKHEQNARSLLKRLDKDNKSEEMDEPAESLEENSS